MPIELQASQANELCALDGIRWIGRQQGNQDVIQLFA
jgi:hypothetical protein